MNLVNIAFKCVFTIVPFEKWFSKFIYSTNFKFPLGDVKEDFIGCTNIMGDTTGEHIAESIITWLQAINLDPSNLRPQSYGGKGMMMSKCDKYINVYQTDNVRQLNSMFSVTK